MTLVKKEECNQNSVTSLIVNHVPDAQLLSSVGAEMEFVLSNEHSNGFETLFQEIESKLQSRKSHLLETLRFSDANDYEYEIFSILGSARA